MTSYKKLIQKIEAFCNAHLMIEKYMGEFREQMPNFSAYDEKYPIVFIAPNNAVGGLEMNQYALDIYCMDVIQKDRANINTILSDTQLILNDLQLYFRDGPDLEVDVIGDPNMTPLNNHDLDYVAGWLMTITFEVTSYGVCAIPMTPITPIEPTCEPATVKNTDSSYLQTVVSGGTLTLPDTTYNVYVNGVFDQSFSIPSLKDETINITA